MLPAVDMMRALVAATSSRGDPLAVTRSVLCVDDEPLVRALIERLLGDAGYDVAAAASVAEARALLAKRAFALALCDIGLPDSSGLELLDELGELRPQVATVMITGHDDPEVAAAALEAGAYGYLTKPFAPNELLIDVANALHRRRLELERQDYSRYLEESIVERTSELRRAYAETVVRLVRAMEYRDGGTGAHVERVAAYAAEIALGLGLGSEWVERIRLATPLHDIGKMAIGDEILLKAGALSEDEFVEVRRHAEVGHELLTGSGNDLLELAATIAWTHHERWDGRGYPRGLRGVEIPLEGRIVAVADVFDALTSDRPYRSRLPFVEARAYVASERGAAFDPQVVDVFLGSATRARLIVPAPASC
jgi:cyclic di-GMP phosphodiesterase